MEYNGYDVTLVIDDNSWHGVKYVRARKNYDEGIFDYFYLSGTPMGNGNFAPFQNQDEAEEAVKTFIDKRTDEDVIHEHFHVLSQWNKKIEPVVLQAQKAFDLDNVDVALEKIKEIGKLRVKTDERWRMSLLGHLQAYKYSGRTRFW